MEPEASKIRDVAVLGLGTMGHGILLTMSVGGCRVRGYDASPAVRQTLIQRLRANLTQMVTVGIIEQERVSEILGRVAVCDTETEAVVGAEFVTEAVTEDLQVKQELFERLESLVEPSAILASNTSSYPITDIAAGMRFPERAVVTHWFNPPHIVPVVEVVPGAKTSLGTTQTAYDFLHRIGKLPVRVNQEIPGFLVNRVQIAMFREIWDLLDRGVASAQEIDRAIRGSMGLRLAALGPLAIIDFAGWDVTARVYQNLIPHQRSDTELPGRIQQLIADRHHGVKSGRGVFEYPPESVQQRIADRDRTYLELVKLLNDSPSRMDLDPSSE
ncbi:MAG: 3-hydroxyacyl-CoA dehydrogenase family protein [Pirellulaceae bacterium]